MKKIGKKGRYGKGGEGRSPPLLLAHTPQKKTKFSIKYFAEDLERLFPEARGLGVQNFHLCVQACVDKAERQ